MSPLRLLETREEGRGAEALASVLLAELEGPAASASLLVLPRSRDVRTWRRALLRRLGPGRVLVTDGFVTPLDLARRILPTCRMATREEKLEGLLRVLDENAIRAFRGPAERASPRGLPELLLRGIEELRRAGLDGVRHRQALAAGEAAQSRDLVFAELHRRFDVWLDARNLHLAEDLPRLAAAELRRGAHPLLSPYRRFAWLSPPVDDVPALELFEALLDAMPEGLVPLDGLAPPIRTHLSGLEGARIETVASDGRPPAALFALPCADEREECRSLARFVRLRLEEDPSCLPRIRLLLRHPRRRIDAFREAFDEHGIDLDAERSVVLVESAPAITLLRLLRVRLAGFPALEWIRALRSPLLAGANPESRDLHLLEALILERGLPPGRPAAWAELAPRARAVGLPHDGEAGRLVGDLMRDLEGRFPMATRPRERLEALEDLVRDWKIAENVASPRRRELRPEEQRLEGRALESFLGLARDVVVAAETGGRDTMELAEFLRALEEGARDVVVRIAPRNRFALSVVSAEGASPDAVDWLLVPGMLEGSFPDRDRRDPLLSEALRATLRGTGPLARPLEGADERRSREERLFRTALGSARHAVVLSHPLRRDDGAPVLRSFFLDALESRRGAPLPRLDLPGGGEPAAEASLCFSPRELRLHLLDRRLGGRATSPDAPALPDEAALGPPFLASNVLAELRRNDLGRPFDERDGRLAHLGAARELVTRRLGDRPFSASQLELYGRCPFAHFARHVLALRDLPAPETTLPPALRGRILHEICRSFFGHHPAPLEADDRAEALRSIDVIGREIFARVRSAWPGLSARLLDLERRRMTEDLAAWIDRLVLRDGEACERRLRPRLLEWAFGAGSTGKSADRGEDDGASTGADELEGRADPRSVEDGLELLDASGRAFRVRGRVDRVDLDEEERFFRIVDYKSTGAGIPSAAAMREGRSLQGQIYGAAAGRLLLPDATLTGWIFVAPLDGGRERGVLDRSWTGSLLSRKIHGRGLVDGEDFASAMARGLERAGLVVDRIRRADFRLDPSDCLGRRCAYRDACRYAPFRSDRKREAERLALTEEAP